MHHVSADLAAIGLLGAALDPLQHAPANFLHVRMNVGNATTTAVSETGLGARMMERVTVR